MAGAATRNLIVLRQALQAVARNGGLFAGRAVADGGAELSLNVRHETTLVFQLT
jgi:hypothetical protein